jgi:hypothetical protein
MVSEHAGAGLRDGNLYKQITGELWELHRNKLLCLITLTDEFVMFTAT